MALARTLASEPRLLLLDEPLAAVDVSARPELRAVLHDTLTTFTGPSILVTHDPVEAMTLADRLVLLEDGRITQEGSPAEVRNHPADPLRRGPRRSQSVRGSAWCRRVRAPARFAPTRAT